MKPFDLAVEDEARIENSFEVFITKTAGDGVFLMTFIPSFSEERCT